MNIHEITQKFDNLLAEQKRTLALQDKLISIAEQLKSELIKRNGGMINC
jgi:hypothetical protein